MTRPAKNGLPSRSCRRLVGREGRGLVMCDSMVGRSHMTGLLNYLGRMLKLRMDTTKHGNLQSRINKMKR